LAKAGVVVSGSEESRMILAGELLDRFPQIAARADAVFTA
jgi:hypothetical protein